MPQRRRACPRRRACGGTPRASRPGIDHPEFSRPVGEHVVGREDQPTGIVGCVQAPAPPEPMQQRDPDREQDAQHPRDRDEVRQGIPTERPLRGVAEVPWIRLLVSVLPAARTGLRAGEWCSPGRVDVTPPRAGEHGAGPRASRIRGSMGRRNLPRAWGRTSASRIREWHLDPAVEVVTGDEHPAARTGAPWVNPVLILCRDRDLSEHDRHQARELLDRTPSCR